MSEKKSLFENRTVLAFLVAHDLGVDKVIDQVVFALNASEGDLAYLAALATNPTVVVETCEKSMRLLQVLHVDERVAHIAHVIEVDWQVKKVPPISESVLVHLLDQVLLTVLIRNILDHQCRARLHSFLQSVNLDPVKRLLCLLVLLARHPSWIPAGLLLLFAHNFL